MIVTQSDIDNAALYWVGLKERETSLLDIEYFKANWRSLPGLKDCVHMFARKRINQKKMSETCFYCREDKNGVSTTDGGFRCPNCKRFWKDTQTQQDRFLANSFKGVEIIKAHTLEDSVMKDRNHIICSKQGHSMRRQEPEQTSFGELAPGWHCTRCGYFERDDLKTRNL